MKEKHKNKVYRKHDGGMGKHELQGQQRYV